VIHLWPDPVHRPAWRNSTSTPWQWPQVRTRGAAAVAACRIAHKAASAPSAVAQRQSQHAWQVPSRTSAAIPAAAAVAAAAAAAAVPAPAAATAAAVPGGAAAAVAAAAAAAAIAAAAAAAAVVWGRAAVRRAAAVAWRTIVEQLASGVSVVCWVRPCAPHSRVRDAAPGRPRALAS